MTSFDSHANFPYSAVVTAPSPATTGTSLTLTTGDGAKMPTPPFNGTVWPSGAQPLTTNAEIVRVTAIASDTLTMTRLAEQDQAGDMVARTIIVGDQFAANVTTKTLTDLESAINNALMPTVLSSGQTLTVAAGTQVLWADGVTLNGALIINGSMRGVR